MNAISIRPKFIIEGIVALAVIAVLFAVSIPRFSEAQIRQRTAKALSELSMIINAMETHSVDQPDQILTDFQILGEAPNGKMIGFATLHYAGKEFLDIRNRKIMPADFKDYIHPIPMPPPYVRLPDGHLIAGDYRVYWEGHATNSNTGFGPLQLPGYLGTSKAPSHADLDAHNTPFDSTTTKQYQVRYNPTNGIISHGFTIYNSTSSVNKNWREVTNRIKAIQISKERNN